MTREYMLNKLNQLPFAYINPSGDWQDVGFTERDIWVNNKGYGYLLCDEIVQVWSGEGIGIEKWNILKEKIQDETITYDDIKDTPIESLIKENFFWDNEYNNQEDLCDDLYELSKTEYPINRFYAYTTDDGTEYFDSEEELNKVYERDWADVYWEEMDESLLSEWIDRLSVEKDHSLVEWAKTLELEPDICEDDIFSEITGLCNIKLFWTPCNNKRYFKFVCTATVFEGAKKRIVTLTAEGKDEEDSNKENCNYVTRTVFDVTSNRKNNVVQYIISGSPKNDTSLATDSDLGKWLPIKDKLYFELLNFVKRVVGHDLSAKSLDLYKGLKVALDTTILDELIQSTEQGSDSHS